jgi:hypothetical protein
MAELRRTSEAAESFAQKEKMPACPRRAGQVEGGRYNFREKGEERRKETRGSVTSWQAGRSSAAPLLFWGDGSQ